MEAGFSQIQSHIYIDHILAAQCPDIVVIDEHQKVVLIVDVTVLSDRNVTMKETEKYKDLSIELSSL